MIKETIVLDASPVLNILGSGSPSAILGSLAIQFIIEESTVKEVIRNPFDGKSAAPVLAQLVGSGVLEVRKMSDAAYDEYLELVSAEPKLSLGRGESAALAYANEIDAVVALDDRKARRIGSSRFPSCLQITSVEIFRRAYVSGQLPRRQMKSLVESALAKARMHVLDEDRRWIAELGLELRRALPKP